MATSRKKPADKQGEPEPETVEVEWFPAYGIRIAGKPHIAIIGVSEVKALSFLAGHLAEEGKRYNKVYTAKFKNDVFEVE